jgi:hypothetical protein
MGTGGCFPGVKQPESEADHSSPSSAEVKNAWSYTSTSQYAFMAWCLGKAQEKLSLFTFSMKLLLLKTTQRKVLLISTFHFCMESKELRVISKMVMNFTFHFRYNYFG